jgi:hypothetical protein
MDSYREHPSDFDLPSSSEVTASEDVAAAIGTDERRMHVRAYNYWVSLLEGRDFPSIEDLEPADVTDFEANSVLLDFTCGRDNPAIPYIGSAIRDECGLEDNTRAIADVPSRSLLSRLTDHYMQIIANRAPIGFEAEFANQREETICYRGILMPFSSDGDTIDFIYGVINWKRVGADYASEDPQPLIAAVPSVDAQDGIEPDASGAAADEVAIDPLPLVNETPAADETQEPVAAVDDAWADMPEEEFTAAEPLGPVFEETAIGAPLDPMFEDASIGEPLELTDAIEERGDEAVELTDAIDHPAAEEPLELAVADSDDPAAQEPLELTVAHSDEMAVEAPAWPRDMVEIQGLAQADAGAEAAAPHFAWEDGPLADVDAGELPPIELDEDAGLADRLWAARETADAAKAGEGRSRAALYRALSLAYDFALAAQANEAEYAELLEESGVKAQARAPMTPIVKLVFGIDYDKARLTEFAAALSYGVRQDVAPGEFHGLIEKQAGGLKALVAAERHARRPEPKADSKSEVARARLRAAVAISLDDVPADDEFAVVITRRGADGRHEAVAIVDDQAIVDRAIRRAA